jgi:uncharacterized protein
MGANADTIKSAFDAFGRGDIDGVLAAWHEDVRWDGVNDDRLPMGGRMEGHQAVAAGLGKLSESWDGFTAVADEVYEDGDNVFVLGHAEGTAKQTGRQTKFPFVHVYRMRDGKAAEILALSDTLEVAKALGVAS